MGDNEVNWINIAVRTAAARLDDKEQAAAVCRYLRGEVERLGKANALLVCENMKLDAELDEVHAELEEHEIQLGKELSTHE